MDSLGRINLKSKNLSSPQNFPDKLSIFGIFYLTALWLEMAESWDTPWATFLGLVLLVVIIFSGLNKLKFCLFVALSTAYFWYFHFPEVANHVNLIIFCNLAILAIALDSWLRSRRFSQPEDYSMAIASFLRISLIAVYFWAGFHKLNTDFFIPQFSCSNSMFLGIIEFLTSRILGIPVFLILGAISWLFLQNAIPQNIKQLAQQHGKIVLFLGLSCLLFLAIAFGSLVYLDLTRFVFPVFILATSILVLLWELFGGVMLFLPRLQVVMFLFSMFMHLVLAPIGFVDFGSLAFALWLTFVPSNYYKYLSQPVNIPGANIALNRTLVYVAINIFGGLISALYYLAYPNFNLKAIAGILFISSVLIVMSPMIKNLLIDPNSWGGVAITNSKMPRFIYVWIALLFLYAATPYLGLRTAGNFSMFSNLRTEGATSNHLLLKNNPLKIWNYQEDVVKVIEIDDEKAKIGHKYRPLKNHSLPVVEFKKLIYKWTKADYQVPLTFKYGDRIYQTDDIVNDPQWRTTKRNWEMKLMDFRVIQPDNGEPNYCRW